VHDWVVGMECHMYILSNVAEQDFIEVTTFIVFLNNVPTMTALFKYLDLPCLTRFDVSITYTILRGICLLPQMPLRMV
jgi:hypothetical protein